MAGPRGAIAQCGLVLKKLDFQQAPNYPSDLTLYSNLDALARDTQNVQNLLTDPLATTGWCEAVNDLLTLASSTTAYFTDAAGNAARDEFVRDWNRVKQLCGCP